MASVFKRHGAGNWLISYYDVASGRRREKSSGTTDKREAERYAATLEIDADLQDRGYVDAEQIRLRAQAEIPMEQHVAEYEAALEAKGDSAGHIEETATAIRQAMAATHTASITAIDAARLYTHLNELRSRPKRPIGNRSFNKRLTALRGFTRWLVKERRLAADPLTHLGKRDEDVDRRRVRRALDGEEIGRLIDAAATGPVRFDLAGEDRAMVYRVAVHTGFRRGELASLTPHSFDLDSDPPTVTVAAGYSKRRRQDVQPIREDLARVLRPWLEKKSASAQLWPLPRETAEMIQADLRSARARWITEAADPSQRRQRQASDFLAVLDGEGRVADFHGTRHTFVSHITNDPRVPMRQAKEAARHHSVTTTERYAHRLRVVGAPMHLDALPSLAAPTPHRQKALATGTYGPSEPQRKPQRAGHETERDGATGGEPNRAPFSFATAAQTAVATAESEKPPANAEGFGKRGGRDSNPQPPDRQSGTLTN